LQFSTFQTGSLKEKIKRFGFRRQSVYSTLVDAALAVFCKSIVLKEFLSLLQTKSNRFLT